MIYQNESRRYEEKKTRTQLRGEGKGIVNRQMDEWKDRWMNGQVDGWMDRGMDGWIDGQMDGWIDGWMDGQTDK